ncbi:hypothetical protein EVAR_100222_1 [Eumeta japonica]|uniref:Uncharacterized protein n=1 Tax=Eumeta variegata TaxID=151549 RepID=A0A4C1ZMU4_EUMVA|nr:hypothetical protein EVAR_100222_1 [Eumeta japonica]
MCIRTAMTYASPVFAHAAPKALNSLQVIQNNFESHPNALLRSEASHEALPYHFIRRPRNVLIDPPDALTAKIESL